MVASRAAFARAVADYQLTDIAPPPEALDAAKSSIERTSLCLLGEFHGVLQTPRAILSIARRLGIRTLAFEWSYDELDDVVQPALSTGSIAYDALWSLPATAEVFSGDGRFTAGHVRLLEHLGDQLDRIVLLDRVGAAGSQREIGMAYRLLAAQRQNSPLLAILGVGHVVRAKIDGIESVGSLVERELPGVANGVLAPAGGTCWFHGEQQVPSVQLPPTDVVIPIGVSTPAVVARP